MPRKKPKKRIKETNLIKEYQKFFKDVNTIKRPESSSLKQPTPFKKVETVVTYGVCEEPLT